MPTVMAMGSSSSAPLSKECANMAKAWWKERREAKGSERKFYISIALKEATDVVERKKTCIRTIVTRGVAVPTRQE